MHDIDKFKRIRFVHKTYFQMCYSENKAPNEILVILQHRAIVINLSRVVINENK